MKAFMLIVLGTLAGLGVLPSSESIIVSSIWIVGGIVILFGCLNHDR